MQSGPRRTASGQFAKRKGGQAAAEEKGGGASSDEGDDFVTADLEEPDRPSSKEAKQASGGTVHALPVEDDSPTGEAELGALKGLISGQLEEVTAELVSRVQLILQQDRVEAAAEGEKRLQLLGETLRTGHISESDCNLHCDGVCLPARIISLLHLDRRFRPSFQLIVIVISCTYGTVSI
eukprot:SAG22_NODE_445_length_10447_cov_4.063104_3_plen_180_part_00